MIVLKSLLLSIGGRHVNGRFVHRCEVAAQLTFYFSLALDVEVGQLRDGDVDERFCRPAVEPVNVAVSQQSWKPHGQLTQTVASLNQHHYSSYCYEVVISDRNKLLLIILCSDGDHPAPWRRFYDSCAVYKRTTCLDDRTRHWN